MAVPVHNVGLASAPRTFFFCCKSFPYSQGQRTRHSVFGRTKDYAGATVVLIRCVEVPKMALWH
eukprot:438019-Pyramimonas_sp.AAC.1